MAQPPSIPRSSRPRTVAATEAKNRFGEILRNVRSGAPVFIERHGTAQAVVLDIDSWRALVQGAREPHEVQLDVLRDEFDALYARMQSAQSRSAVRRLLSAPAAEINRAALKRRARGRA